MQPRIPALALSTLLCCSATFAGDVEDIIGTWALSDEAREAVAEKCQSLQYRIDRTSITLTSGQMVLITRFDVQSKDSVIVLGQVVLSHNGLPNCSGYVIPYPVGQRINNVHLEPRGDRLRMSLRNERYVEFVRVSR